MSDETTKTDVDQQEERTDAALDAMDDSIEAVDKMGETPEGETDDEK